MKASIDYAKDEAWRSVDAGNPEDAEKYAISAHKQMAIARTWKDAIELAVCANGRIMKYGEEKL